MVGLNILMVHRGASMWLSMLRGIEDDLSIII